MSEAEKILAEAERRADERNDEVILRLLARFEEPDVPRVCKLHEYLRQEYVRTAINHHRARKRWQLLDSKHGPLRDQMRQAESTLRVARLNFRQSVARCGCSDKYTLDGRKRR